MARVMVRRVWRETVGHRTAVLLHGPRRHCQAYGYWVWAVMMPGKQPDSFRRWNAAICHAVYVAKNPHVMQESSNGR